MKNHFLRLLLITAVGFALVGCLAPIGADRATTRQVYEQVGASPLRTGKPSAPTIAALHRYDLDDIAASEPDEAVRRLHQKALETRDRDLLFALAEMSYVAGERIRRSVKPWDPRDPRDYYLGSAVYAWLFVFGDTEEPPPRLLDRRLRQACDLYNYGLGLALIDQKRTTNDVVRLQSGTRRLPVGEINLTLSLTNFPARLEDFEQFLLADRFRVRGLTVRNREPGVGAPLLAVRHPQRRQLGLRRALPATVFLRIPGSLAAVAAGTNSCPLELYSAFDEPKVTIGKVQIPLETDLTTHLAYNLNQSKVWDIGMMQFLSPSKNLRSQLIDLSTFRTDRIPVVFVHGTFSSPVTWAELNNTLSADPVVREHFQFWDFIYSSGNSAVISAGELRDALIAKIQELDPRRTNTTLRQMVIVGHSQGGLLTKMTATDTGDKIWRAFSNKPLEEFPVAEQQREKLRRLLFLEHLPFVRRVVFISTPHRGSYLASNFVRSFVAKLMTLPSTTVNATQDVLNHVKGDSAERWLQGHLPTSLDSMSPDNPGLLALADLPVAPGIKAHSIISVRGEGDFHDGRDGLVDYKSAHQYYVESEFIVRSFHTCLNKPATIEELRRILHEHLEASKAAPGR
jgi:pimeloyl-ACP methyl ester carboxylesterase